jgi:2-oxoglutarate ferredoxin oxidoreductase subunit alpha
MDFVFKIAGQAGAGVMVSGRSMAKCFSRKGYHVVAYPEYPSLIRGGHNTVQIRVSDERINSPVQEQDILVALNKDAIFYHMSTMKKGGVILYDELIDITKFQIRKDVKMHPLPLARIIQETGGSIQMKNTATIGAALATAGYPFEVLERILHDEFIRKGEDVVKLNVKVAKAGYDHAQKNGMRSVNSLKPIADKKRMMISGNEAIALGAVAGGMRFYSAYPMTPASSVLHYLASKEREFNYAIGASFAGVRAMTGTSGGGFALMTEALGMAAISETPLVIVLAQRTGPSTGMPTWTEQADLRFALHASQGDFLRVILAPGDVGESFALTAKAHNIAEKFQIPVIIMMDKHISETVFSSDEFDWKSLSIDRGKLARDLPPLPEGERWKRYGITKDGVSPRAIPGNPNGIHLASSYEHREDGFSTESFFMRKEQADKRTRKIGGVLKEMDPPQVYGDKGAEITLIGWGSTKLAALDSLHMLRAQGVKARYVHFTHLFPLDAKAVVKAIGKSKATFIVENNSSAQFAGMLKQYASFEADFTIIKYDGRPFFPEQIAEQVGKVKKAGYKGKKEIAVGEKEDLEYYNPQRYGL